MLVVCKCMEHFGYVKKKMTFVLLEYSASSARIRAFLLLQQMDNLAFPADLLIPEINISTHFIKLVFINI